MTKRSKLKRALIATVVAALVIAFLVYGVQTIGVASPAYRVRDHDPVLSGEADAVRPLIARIEAYRLKEGRYPEDLHKLGIATLSSSGPGTSVDPSTGWTYAPAKHGYVLWLKVGWDPALSYVRDAGDAYWVFDPGDGSPEKRLKL